jgi:hypothetical protein
VLLLPWVLEAAASLLAAVEVPEAVGYYLQEVVGAVEEEQRMRVRRRTVLP